MQRAWWQGESRDLALADPDAVLGQLTRHCRQDVIATQTDAWRFTIAHLKDCAAKLPAATIFLELSIPRMGRRADAVIICGGLVYVLEYKVGASGFSLHAREQVHGYALDLKNFHAASHALRIIPILIATEAPAQPIGLGFAPDGVAAPMCLAPDDLVLAVQQSVRVNEGSVIDAVAWAESPYRPTPTIIEAAQALFRGHQVEEISRSEAGAENLTRTAEAIGCAIATASSEGRKSLCLVTGVPGAGKTLAGLNLACSRLGHAGEGHAGEDATFLSGNGPLVEVLREALRRDLRRREKAPDPSDPEARHMAGRSPDKFVQNVHRFRDEYLAPHLVPPEHVVVFDEAQRAWNREQTSKFMREKRGQVGFDQSEPAFLLGVMNRRPDWCTIVCLIGEGQEINTGEAGISAWVEALAAPAFADWRVHASPQLMVPGGSLDRQARHILAHRGVQLDEALHLAVSVRSFRAEAVSAFVAALLQDDAAAARRLKPDQTAFPVWRTRSLEKARTYMRSVRRAGERSGLLASSNAIRLKPEGLHVKARADVANWFLNDVPDIRASSALEDVGTEFDVQGLELDWTCVAWDLNLMRSDAGWEPRRFRGTSWQAVNDPDARTYVRNAYRVLLTRARQGMVIFIPHGDLADATRPPAAYDAIDRWLGDCGISELPGQ